MPYTTRSYLIDLRRQRNETQQSVADALNVSRQYYAMVEKGERQKRMDLTMVTAIANHFGLSPVEVLNEENQLCKAAVVGISNGKETDNHDD